MGSCNLFSGFESPHPSLGRAEETVKMAQKHVTGLSEPARASRATLRSAGQNLVGDFIQHILLWGCWPHPPPWDEANSPSPTGLKLTRNRRPFEN